MKSFNKLNRDMTSNITKMASGFLLLKLIENMGKLNDISLSRSELLDMTGMSTSAVTTALKELKAVDLVRKRGQQQFMVNPHYCHYGTDANFYVVKYKWDEIGNHARTV